MIHDLHELHDFHWKVYSKKSCLNFCSFYTVYASTPPPTAPTSIFTSIWFTLQFLSANISRYVYLYPSTYLSINTYILISIHFYFSSFLALKAAHLIFTWNLHEKEGPARRLRFCLYPGQVQVRDNKVIADIAGFYLKLWEL